MRTGAVLIALLAGLLFGGHAAAHKPSDSYLSLAAEANHLDGQWDIALRDLEFALGLDRDDNGEITWGEVKAMRRDIEAYALARLTIRQGETVCPVQARDLLIDTHTDGAYAVIRFAGECAQPIAALGIEYRLFFDLDTQHKGLLKLAHGGAVQSAVFAVEQPARQFVLLPKSRFEHFGDYLIEGVFHIWIGIDHILFLLALLLPAVLTRLPGARLLDAAWQPSGRFRTPFYEVLKVVTAFTVAHSITLTLATLGWVQLPSRFVESVIALSVVLAAFNNLLPLVAHGRWLVAFFFGLIHGFGFASVLSDLGLPEQALLVALLGFNLGVEVGQLAIVAGFLPLAYALRRGTLYRQVILRGGSGLIIAVAAAWFVERAFDLKLLPF